MTAVGQSDCVTIGHRTAGQSDCVTMGHRTAGQSDCVLYSTLKLMSSIPSIVDFMTN